MMSVIRRLAAIPAADIARYGCLMGKDKATPRRKG